MKTEEKIYRIKMLKAMEYIARHIADEEVFEYWLVNGIADGDINNGDLGVNEEDINNLEYYLSEESFEEIATEFLTLMKYARKDGFSLRAEI